MFVPDLELFRIVVSVGIRGNDWFSVGSPGGRILLWPSVYYEHWRHGDSGWKINSPTPVCSFAASSSYLRRCGVYRARSFVRDEKQVHHASRFKCGLICKENRLNGRLTLNSATLHEGPVGSLHFPAEFHLAFAVRLSTRFAPPCVPFGPLPR